MGVRIYAVKVMTVLQQISWQVPLLDVPQQCNSTILLEMQEKSSVCYGVHLLS